MDAAWELIIITGFRGLERLLIVYGAIYVVRLGFRLYELGITKGDSNASFTSAFVKFAVSGTGPGLLFMTGGILVLVVALFMPVSTKNTTKVPQNSDQSLVEITDLPGGSGEASYDPEQPPPIGSEGEL